MSISDYERELLAELENQLNGDKEQFSSPLSAENAQVTRWAISPKNLVSGLVIAILGLAVVLGGVSVNSVPVGVLGTVIVFAGFWYVSLGLTKKLVTGKPRANVTPDLSFMEKQMQEWAKRIQQDPNS